jgi:serine/threonine protein kinase
LLTGQLVFSADTVMGLLVHHAHTAPVPPSARAEVAISADLDALVMSCLAKDPADRPQTARELARQLDEMAASDRWTDERARVWWATHQPTSA